MSSPHVPREPALMSAFIDIADTMIDDYDVIDLAHRLAHTAPTCSK